MRITLDYDPNSKNLSVLVDRGALSAGDPPWPPPPPSEDEFAEMTVWLNTVYKVCLDQFAKDQKVGAVRFKYEPSLSKQIGYKFIAEAETPPQPPSFVRSK